MQSFPTQINFKLATKFFSLLRSYFATIDKAKEPSQNQWPSFIYKEQNKRNIYITLEMFSPKMLENVLLYNHGFFKCQCTISIHLLIYDSLHCFILNIIIYEITWFGCKQDKMNHICHLKWLFRKQRVCLLRWCGRLGLVIKRDGLKIYPFTMNKKIHDKRNVTLYYSIKVLINIVHDRVIFNAFQVIQCFFWNNKNTCYNVLNMYNLNILYSFDSLQNFPHVPIIYYNYFHLNKLKFCNINIVLTLKHEKLNIDYNYYSHPKKWK